jgi:uncharacterized protein
MLQLSEHDPLALAALGAIRNGDVEALRQLLGQHSELASAAITRRASSGQPAFSYALIGATTDWPGQFPRVGESIAALVAAGADVNARCGGPHGETPLHFAASSDDVVALDALLDAGADIEAAGAVIAGGTALDDAVAFAQWRAARRLLERGAQAAVWHCAALGALERLEAYFAAGRPRAKYPWRGADSQEREVTVAFWCACHGGQPAAVRYLLDRGAELNWISPWDGLTPLDAARRSAANDVVAWLSARGGKSAKG